MVVGALTVHLHIPWARSLKDKRSAVQGMLRRIRHRFNVSASEVDLEGAHQEALVAFTCAARDEGEVRSLLEAVRRFLEGNGELEVLSAAVDLW
jgi:uncharacterized protein YlxP (DUF503 family)